MIRFSFQNIEGNVVSWWGCYLAQRRRSLSLAAQKRDPNIRAFCTQLSWTLKAFEQEIDGLADQLSPAGMLRIRQLIQRSQLALPQVHAHCD